MDTITLVNLILCATIVVFGCVAFRKAKERWPLYIAITFGLYGISHVLTLLGLQDALEVLVIAIRTIAYLLVIYTLYLVAFKK